MTTRQVRAMATTVRAADHLGAALAYATRGWSVVPIHAMEEGVCSCHRRGCPSVAKHPRIRWGSRMTERASRELVARWWARWPGANLGIVTGAIAGVVVLDVDPRSGGEQTVAVLEAEWGVLPATWIVQTGGGGRHHWFAMGEQSVATMTLGPGLDLKGEGGLVVVPPSRHASGEPYVWAAGRSPDDITLAPVPEWLITVARTPLEEGRPGEREPPVRTGAEQEEFAEAWGRLGIELEAGDQYYLCPFHQDHHPSLHVDAEGCRWYCFGCGRGGGTGALHHRLGEHTKVRGVARLTGPAGRQRPVSLHGRRRVDIVGESYHQDALLELCGRRRRYGGVEMTAVAELVPDPDNPYDPKAVEVRIDDQPVGHIRHEDLEWLWPEIEDALDLHGFATCRAEIRGGWDRGRGDVGLFGVVLLLPA